MLFYFCFIGTNDDSAPYYVIIGDKPTNVKKLNAVIENYYKKNKTLDRKPQNSPMIIKLAN